MPQVPDTNLWQDLIVSILAVNQYTLSYTYKSLESLRAVGMFEAKNIMNWSANEIEVKLEQGGCDRGAFMTGLFAGRIAALGELLAEKGIEECKAILLSANRKDIEALLLPVKGIGPKVLENFFLLRQIE